jgi:hypothetical protein
VLLSFQRCSKNAEPLPLEPSDFDFGYPYSIVEPAEGNVIVKADTVYAKIAISGCAESYNFEMEYTDQSCRWIVWLKNNEPASACDGYFEYWVKYRLPGHIRTKGKKILFIGPSAIQVFLN